MRFAEIALSSIIAFVVVYIVFQNNEKSAVPLSSSSNNYTVTIDFVPIAAADTILTIPVTIIGDKNEDIMYFFRYAPPKMRDPNHLHRYSATPLMVVDSAAGLYKTSIRTDAKGTLSYYYFEIRDPIGRYVAGLKSADGQALTTLAVGQVDGWVKYGSYTCLLIAAMLVSMGASGSIRLIAGKAHAETIGKTFLAAAVFTSLAALILGNLYRLQLVGGGWQGAPWGINIADNLKQILVLFLVFLSLAAKIVRTKSGKMRTVFSGNLIGYLGIASFFVMITALLLPLLVRTEYEHIPAIFYSILALLAMFYFLVFRQTKHA